MEVLIQPGCTVNQRLPLHTGWIATFPALDRIDPVILGRSETTFQIHILGMVIQPFNRNPYNGFINPYYWVDDHPLLYGNNILGIKETPDGGKGGLKHDQFKLETFPVGFTMPWKKKHGGNGNF